MSATALVLGVAVAALLVACSSPPPKPATYGAELAACTATSSSCEASIACENEVRARYGRAPRDASKGCK
jgi:uncharacterized lipoprotein YbaY